MKEVKQNGLKKILSRAKPENKIFVDLALAISEQVRLYLKESDEINSQKTLSSVLGKEESEVSKWLSGLHNLTIESIAKMTVALGKPIIMTDSQARDRYQKTTYIVIANAITAKDIISLNNPSKISPQITLTGNSEFEYYLDGNSHINTKYFQSAEC